tara:strand:- start:262 stop:663 length:402 start_codon:yes stop_codon:yes gene_type:complete
MNKCDWCGNTTKNPECYVAMSPLIKKYEKLIKEWDKKYGQFWYDSKEIDKELLDDAIIYDQATNTVGRGVICNDCQEKDEKIYQKYKLITTKEGGDPYGMMKIVVDTQEEDIELDKMEEWHKDIKERRSNLDE